MQGGPAARCPKDTSVVGERGTLGAWGSRDDRNSVRPGSGPTRPDLLVSADGEEKGAGIAVKLFRPPYYLAVAIDEGLAERIRSITGGDPRISERKMFGGLCFMLDGNMCFGVLGDEIMVRVGAAAYDEALALPHAREMDFTGRSMRGMVYVEPDGIAEDDDLSTWLQRGLDMARSLPPKSNKHVS